MACTTANAESEYSCPARLRRQRNVYDILFGRRAVLLSVFALCLSFALPVDGVRLSVCWFQNLFELPCPGCGLTRSVTNISHLDFTKAWHYHPFGFPVYGLFCAAVIVHVLPSRRRQRLRRWFGRHHQYAFAFYMALVLSFVTFGLLRTLVVVGTLAGL